MRGMGFHPTRGLAFSLLALIMIPLADASADGAYPYKSCFEIASKLHDIPMDLLLAVAATESNWDPDARSHANAHGIMQIQWPGTARHLGVNRLSELYNPCLNIDLGARYLRELLDRNGGDETRALAAYNYGPSRIEGLSRLPDGAQRYVATVDAHRSRIGAAAAHEISQAGAAARHSKIHFDHRVRASRFVDLLNRQVASARFTWAPTDDGRYAVTMQTGPKGLSLADAGTLQALGWTTLGSSP